MKLPIAFIFQPAQEFTVRIAATAQEMTRGRQPALWDGIGGTECDRRQALNKRRWRAKLHRQVLQMEAI